MDKIQCEKCWELTAKTLIRFIVLQGDKLIAPLLGRGEGVIAPVMGKEKWLEINEKVFGEGGKQLYPWIKEAFNIPVEDVIGAVNLVIVGETLMGGGLIKHKLVATTPERAVLKITKCPWWEGYEEFEVDPELRACDPGHPIMIEEAFKIINPKISYTLTKALPRGDPYCEEVFEFKEE
ncbi:hypothetical protein [Candidatus Borrarchaeum sp.]|uniref:hypothetical protein n=1 Tax=Candidatus Borrarchaeum sp. TaxID=2846742 RepID=UPI0025806A60|nr:hypothetical protein [Candidatus Borrarchaeum sp.]